MTAKNNSIKEPVMQNSVQKQQSSPSNDFDAWLKTVGKKFASLNDDNKNRTLDYLIHNSGARQLYHLSEKLNCLLKRDFLKHLPIEMSFYLLKFLDPQSLLSCCQVSKTWNKTVNSCVDCWKRSCDVIGVKVTREFTEAKDYKKLFMLVFARQESLKNGTALDAEFLHGHTDRVMAIYYNNGLLATGSDDRTVRLWDCDTGQCIKIYRTHTVADVKFDSKQIITASFDNTAACWDMVTGERVRHYRGHIGAVFTVDYDEEVDVLVTGGVDYTIKIWMFSEALLLHSLNTYNAGWITRVLLHKPEANCKQFSVICIDYSYIYVWNIDGQQKVRDFRGWPASHSCFVPSLLKKDDNLYCCVADIQRSMYSIQRNELTCGSSSNLTALCYPGAGIQAMFGIGDRFSMFLSDTPVDGYMLDIIQENSRRFTSIELPDCRPTRRGSTFTLGEKAWLDGFDGSNDRGVFFAASLRDHSIYLLKWKSQPTRKAPVVTEFPTRPNSIVSISSEKAGPVGAAGSTLTSPSIRSPPDEDEGSFNLVTGPPLDNAIHRDQQLLTTPHRQSRTLTCSLAAQVFDMPEGREGISSPLVVTHSREGSGEPGAEKQGVAAGGSVSQSLSIPAGTSRSSSSSPNSSHHRNSKSSRSTSPYESDI